MKAGYVVIEAADGLDALTELETATVHLMVYDVNMPRMDGFSFVGRVKALMTHRFTPIVMLTLGKLNCVFDFSMLVSGKVALDIAVFRLGRELDAVLAALSRQVPTNVAFEWHLDDSVRGAVQGDAPRVRQILNNVVGNALKFTKQGTVSVRVTRLASRVTIVVADTGCGIAADRLESVSKGFEQGDTSPSRGHGVGLGLAVACRLSELMAGCIEIESSVGVGTTVRIELLLPVVADELHGVPTPIPASTPLRILVAEDNLINQRVAQRILESWGHEVEVVGNGLDAVARAAAGGLNLILMDLDMPELGGIAATIQIRQREAERQLKRLPIIALTASTILGDHARCLDAGMDDYVSKPIHRNVLQRVVASCAAGSPSAR